MKKKTILRIVLTVLAAALIGGCLYLNSLLPIITGILHNYEKIWTEIYAESRPASYAVADLVVDAIKATPEGRLFRLGLTTGTTPTSLYNELARRYQEQHLCSGFLLYL